MSEKSASSANSAQITLLVLGMLVVVFIWAIYAYQFSSSRTETLQARQSEHRNLSLVISESLKQMTDRARAIGSLMVDDVRQNGNRVGQLPALLVEDKVFHRLSMYTADGQLLYASDTESTSVRLSQWQDPLREHIKQHGFVPVLSPVSTAIPTAERAVFARLPFLVPFDNDDDGQLDRVILAELDVGYLASLLQHVELGLKGFVQILDSNGNEWMRADTSGMIQGGVSVPAISPALGGRLSSGQATFVDEGQRYQRVYVTRSHHGFTVGVAQPYNEILGSFLDDHHSQLIFNVLMTLLIAGIVFWLVRALRQQQRVMHALQLSKSENHQLIRRLEGEHARSSRAASIDHLSGLYNRRQFLDIASKTLTAQRQKRCLTALLFIDLDRFKSINDSLGHQMGDLLLQAVAGRIRRLLGVEDSAARFGGDEFVVLLAGDRSEEDIEHWAAELTRHLSATYELDGTELNSSPSVGIAICPRDSQTIEDLLRQADAAMYSAKKAGRGFFHFFDESLNLRDLEEFHLEQSFEEALTKRQFVLHYQPQACLDSPIVSSTIILAKRMNLKVVAEGVETRDQLVHLKVAGCDIAQGYHLSRPMPPEDVSAFMSDYAGEKVAV